MLSRFPKFFKSRLNKIMPFNRTKNAELANKVQKMNYPVASSNKIRIFEKSDFEATVQGKSTAEIAKIYEEYDVIVLFPTGKNKNYDFKKEKKIAKNQLNNNLVATNKPPVHPKMSSEEKIVTTVFDKNIPEYIKFKKSASIMSELSHEENLDTLSAFQKERIDI